MKRRTLLGSALAAAALPRQLAAQRAGKFPRIGFVTPQAAAGFEPFRGGRGELGYAEGRNLGIEFRYGDNQIGRVPELVAELVRQPVDLLVLQGGSRTRCRQARSSGPCRLRIQRRPGHGGLCRQPGAAARQDDGPEFHVGRAHRQTARAAARNGPGTAPRCHRAQSTTSGRTSGTAAFEEAGRRLEATIAYFPTRSVEELTAALTAMSADPPQAISVFSDGFAVQHRARMIDFQSSRKVPLIAGWAIFSQSGALCTYGPNLSDSYRRLAYCVDRILKGAKPSELPIEQPTKFELVLNLKSANQLGITIPQSVLARATEVIE